MRGPLSYLTGIRHPEGYHGRGREHDYFEGWYVKVVSPDQRHRYAIIPGIFRGTREQGGVDDHAFIQVLDGMTGHASYHRFDVDAFSAQAHDFDVTVGKNRFTRHGFQLDLPEISGEIAVTSDLDPWPVTLRSPGIMGWYGLVPLMECFHGIVSFGHDLSGSVRIQSAAGTRGSPRVSFDGGRGYIEKDWGSAFPAGYLWINSNHIVGNPDACLIGSVAIIPWLRRPFRGFIVGLRTQNSLSTWTTYNRSRERSLKITDAHIEWVLDGPDGRMEINAERRRGGLLKAPMRTDMIARVDETLDAVVSLSYSDVSGRSVLTSEGTCAGMEVFGDIDRLLGLSPRASAPAYREA